MLCSRLENPSVLTDRRYVAEPKLDGQRAQVHISDGRTVACYSRPVAICCGIRAWPGSGRSPGLSRLRCSTVKPVRAMATRVLFEERNRVGGDMSVLAFDLLELNGQDVMREPWKDRRKRLEDVFAGLVLPRIGLVPVTEGAATLYEKSQIDWG